MSALPALAIVTPSYAADHARCKLLCESLDAMADSPFRHYILVADHDLPLFAPLAGPRRVVIPDADLLPRWMRAIRRPFDKLGRHVWISTDIRKQIRPLSGWHVQQLRKLAAARLVDEDVIVMADSDSVFIRPFGASSFMRDGAVRLYRKPAAITGMLPENPTHGQWTRLAASVLGLPEPTFPADDFINNLVSWRKDHALAASRRIAEVGGAPTELVLGRAATLSEYQIYGAYARGVADMAGHFASADALSHTYWDGGAMDQRGLDRFMAELSPHQIALCVQSFTETPLELIRALVRKGAPATAHT
jgi:hypothetical protein